MQFEENKDDIIKSLKSQLSKEIKDHKETKKAFESLEKEYRECEREMKKSYEEKERMKIKEKDMTAIIELNTESDFEKTPKIVINVEKQKEVLSCTVCEYPFSCEAEMNQHIPKHNSFKVRPEVNNICSLCSKQFISNNEFKHHINMIHNKKEFNCQECDFQASSQIILNKHINLKHKDKESVQESTIKCAHCSNQYSSMWNLKNHLRDDHEIQEECSFYQKGSCKFPDKVCWNKNSALVQKHTESKSNNIIKCYDCRETFQRISNMMLHRNSKHPDKVRPCKNPESCEFTICWYMHIETSNSNSETASNSNCN